MAFILESLLMKAAYRVLYYPLQLSLRLLIILGLFTLTRLIFILVNAASFPNLSFPQLSTVLLAGIRFDLSAIIYVNAFFILSYLLPFPFREKKWYRSVQLMLFLVFNFFALLLELIDAGFFSFSFKRSVGSDLKMMLNSFQLTPRYLWDYWYLVLVLALAFGGMYFLYKKTRIRPPLVPAGLWSQVLIFFLLTPLFVIGMRGGLQLRPLTPIAAAEYVNDMRLAPAVSNTTLNILFSTQQNALEVPDYFSEAGLQEYFSAPAFSYHPDTSATQKNIVIIVLESFGTEQVGYFNPNKKSNTPFLDSLLNLAWMPEHGFANGLRSTQGIVAITAGIPALMEDPLMFSAYQSNQIHGLAAVLKKRAYTTGFFHGSNPGSMEFERFARLSGFDHFYDKTDYGKEADYDGNWGIWDVPFFDFFANTLDEYQTPFLGLIFSLTSHHPYAVESWFAEKYPEMDIVERSYLYTDFALRQFFAKAEKMDWYANTLFVITADHVAPPKTQTGNTRFGRYRIPIGIFDPSGNFHAPQQQVMQQIDLFPSLIDYLSQEETGFHFGQSIFDTLNHHYAYQYAEGFFQILDEEYLLLFDGEKSTGLFHYTSDADLQQNLLGKKPDIQEQMETRLKAIIQRHHQGMVKNKLY